MKMQISISAKLEQLRKNDLEKAKLARTALNKVMPDGFKVKVVKFMHMGVPLVSVMLDKPGTKKAQSLAFSVNAEQTKFTVQYCPASFMGKREETWVDEKLKDRALTTANIEKALRKYEFL
jgi:hypothetical protein